jgi:hypothetical protein
MNDHYTGGNALRHTSPIVNLIETHEEFIEMLKEEINSGTRIQNSIFSPAQTYRMQAFTSCFARRFAVTENGHMALVSPEAMAGDWVCCVRCYCPVHLRQTIEKGHFELVGDAYVHGIMNGEALAKDTSSSDIILI